MGAQRRDGRTAVKLENILLGVLLQHPSTGYDLKKYLDSHGRFLRSNTQMSQVYRALGQMEASGWVEHTVEHRPGAQDAKTYRVTEEGAVVFLDWLTSPYSPPSRFEDPDLGARLAFAAFMTPEDLVRLLDVEIDTRESEIARFRFRDRRQTYSSPVPVDAALGALVGERTHEKGADAMDAHVAWCRRLRDELLDRAPDAADQDAVTTA